MSLGMIGIPLFFILSKYKVLRCCYLTLGLISLLTTIHLVNRSGLAICILCFVSVFIYYFRNSRVRLIVLISLIVLLYFILLNSGIINSDIVDAYERRNQIARHMRETFERGRYRRLRRRPDKNRQYAVCRIRHVCRGYSGGIPVSSGRARVEITESKC